ncbi:hypothetical protein [Methanorbis furvi]|uniref:Zinc ribbon domain-containing protein n=1 Tax=Methanorbis furvi TaxID=3028299 RepID=A0AAE4MDV7_9EURY|nr:hypothetical protein [Methanocorpusculaceae archaeon Ag1]
MQIDCPKCRNTFEFTHAADQFTCPYCGTITSLNKADTLYLYTMPFTITDQRANDVFKKWAASSDKIHDLLVKCTDKQWNKYYLPVGKIVRILDGMEQVSIFSLSENNPVNQDLHIDTIPPGELLFYEGGILDAQAIMPDRDMNVLLTEYMGKPKEQAVIFVPVYHLQYKYGGTPYSLLINGVTGTVYTDAFPKATDNIYRECTKKYLYIGIVCGVIAGIIGLFQNTIFSYVNGWMNMSYLLGVNPWFALRNIVSLIIFLGSIIGVIYFSHRDGSVLLDELEKNRSYEETTETEA